MVAQNPRQVQAWLPLFAPADPDKTVLVRPHWRRPPKRVGPQWKREAELTLDLTRAADEPKTGS